MNKETKIIGILAVVTVIAMIGGAILLGGQSTSPTPGASVSPQVLVSDSSYTKGNPEAKVQIVEFSDFQCPACAGVEPVVSKVTDEYGDKISFVYRHFPLPQHKNAILASLAAEAAGKQGKFWEMHALLFEKQAEWAEEGGAKELFISFAKELELNEEQFKSDLDDQVLKDKINKDKADGDALGVNSTPSFYINGGKYTGALSYDQMKSLIDSLLQ